MKLNNTNALSSFLNALQRAMIPLIALVIAVILLKAKIDFTVRLIGWIIALPILFLGLYDVL